MGREERPCSSAAETGGSGFISRSDDVPDLLLTAEARPTEDGQPYQLGKTVPALDSFRLAVMAMPNPTP